MYLGIKNLFSKLLKITALKTEIKKLIIGELK